MENRKQKAYRLNVMRIIRHHKEFCTGEYCDISLLLLKQMAEETGVEFTQKELEEIL